MNAPSGLDEGEQLGVDFVLQCGAHAGFRENPGARTRCREARHHALRFIVNGGCTHEALSFDIHLMLLLLGIDMGFRGLKRQGRGDAKRDLFCQVTSAFVGRNDRQPGFKPALLPAPDWTIACLLGAPKVIGATF